MTPPESFDPSGEGRFLSGYSLEDFDRPSVTADIAMFTMRSEESPLYRLNPEPQLCLLLIRRGEHPFLGKWALPGGFLRRDETIEDCAFRELKEESGITPVSLIPGDVFTLPGRDPRGWIISHAFAGIIREEDASLCGGSDASDAQWFALHLTDRADGRKELTLSGQEETLQAVLEPTVTRTGQIRYRITENEGLAFDHAAIALGALDTLRENALRLGLVFSFLPEQFTLSAMQKVQETLMGETYLPANYRRKVAEQVTETEEFTTGAGHRPARLFRRAGHHE